MRFEEYLAAFALGRVDLDGLRQAAMQAVEEGRESPHLAALAGTVADERSASECEALWFRGLDELGATVPTREEAGRMLRRHYAGFVVSGTLPPRTGAAKIVELARDLSNVLPDREYAGDGFGVARLLGLYYSHDDVAFDDERAHHEIDADLVAECRRLLEADGN